MPVDGRIKLFDSVDVKTRRGFLKSVALAGASFFALFYDQTSVSAGDKKKDIENDVKILNKALGFEHLAIAVYKKCIEKGILAHTNLHFIVEFMKHHELHRDALANEIKKFGGKPVPPNPSYDVDQIAKEVGVNELRTEPNIIRLAVKIESQAISTHYDVLMNIVNKKALKTAAAIIANDAQHNAILRNTLSEDPIPSAFVN